MICESTHTSKDCLLIPWAVRCGTNFAHPKSAIYAHNKTLYTFDYKIDYLQSVNRIDTLLTKVHANCWAI